MPTTTNFGWTTPADTDLVKDGASAMRTLGNGIDTSLVYLKGGTTGQILSKTSNTDLAFTWINNDQGDLTAITAGTGISVTSGTGPIPTVAIDTATTVDKTTAQTLTNKTLTAPIISTISNTGTLTLPTSTDTLVGRATTDTLTNKTISGASNTISNVSLTSGVTGTLPIGNGGTNLTTYTTGDLPYASASNTLSKLAIGTSGQVLTVSGGVPTWSTPAASASGLTFIKEASFSSVASVVVSSCFSATYDNYLILYWFTGASDANQQSYWRLRNGSTNLASGYINLWINFYGDGTNISKTQSNSQTEINTGQNSTSGDSFGQILMFNPYNSVTTRYIHDGTVMSSGTYPWWYKNNGFTSNTSQQDSITFITSYGTYSGKIRVYGIANS